MADEDRPRGLSYTGEINLGQILTILAVVVPILVYYFTGQSSTSDRISKVASDMSDRVSKLETRTAVIEQHQSQTDSAVADNRNELNSFAVEVRSQLGKISEQIAELRPLIVNRPGDGTHR